jgi:D-alanyl-lipoteichoic acid acyltransferase DltB (MBOAT superfamily)
MMEKNMIEILNFLFQDFWHWLGATIWILIIATCISEIRLWGKR